MSRVRSRASLGGRFPGSPRLARFGDALPIQGPQPRLGFAGSGISDFRTPEGGPDRTGSITVLNIGFGDLGALGQITFGTPSYILGTPGWLSVTNYNDLTGIIDLLAASAGMPVGRHEALLPVRSSLAENSEEFYFAIFVIDPVSQPQLTITPATLSFIAAQGGANPAQQISVISNTGGGSLGTLSIGAVTDLSGSQPSSVWLVINIVGNDIEVDCITGTLTEVGGPVYAVEVEIHASGDPTSPRFLTIFFNISASQSTATYLGAALAVGDQQILYNPVLKQFDNTVMITGGESFTGAVHSPIDSAALQTLLTASPRIIQNGDQVRLTPGTNYDASAGTPFRWPSGLTNYVALQTSDMSGFAPRGTRISGIEAYATLRTPTHGGSESECFQVQGNRGYAWVRGVRMTQHPSQTQGSRLVRLGDDPPGSAAGLATRVVFDRCFFDVSPARDNASQFCRGCMDLEATYVAVEDSIMERFHAGQDAYTWRSTDGRGPFKFINTRMMSSCVGWLTGGSPQSYPGGGPADVEMRRCWSHKDPTKKGVIEAGFIWNAKNLGEFKNMDRALITDMYFEYHWGQGQIGHFLAFTNYESAGIDERMKNIVVAFSHARNVAAGVQYLNANTQASKHGPNVLSHILMERINIAPMTVASGLPRIVHQQRGGSVMEGIAIRNLTVDCPSAHSFIIVDGPNGAICTIADIQDNLCHHGAFGFFFTFYSSNPGAGIAAAYPTNTFRKNILFSSGNPALWPGGGTTPAADNVIGIAPAQVYTLYPPASSTNFTVPDTSQYNAWGSNGEDPGADIALILAKTAHCVDGNWN